MNRLALALSTAICASLLVSLPAAAYKGGKVAAAGTISGKVRFTGKVPPAKAIVVTKDKDYCGKKPIPDERLLVGPGGMLRNAIVFIDKIKEGKPLRPSKPKLVNTGCHYVPHVQAFAVGSELRVVNADPVLHNTHVRLPRSDVLNYGLPRKGQVIKKRMRRKGLMRVGCDAGHTWMRAYIAVFNHPYFAVTGQDGSFSLTGVPAGRHKVTIWHEKLGRKQIEVQVVAGKTAKVTAVYK